MKITDIGEDDIEKIGVQEIQNAQAAQVQRERLEKIRQRKMESKRVDHLARAMREEQRASIDDWSANVVKEDEEFLNEAETGNGQKGNQN
jgi:hypothetical protein